MTNNNLPYEQVEKINQLNSSTVLRKRAIFPGFTEEWHEHPETNEVIVVHTECVPDGECVAYESQIVALYPYRKDFANCIRVLEKTFQALDKMAVEKNG